jgi:hypothetical protein
MQPKISGWPRFPAWLELSSLQHSSALSFLVGFEPLASMLERAGDISGVGVLFGRAPGQPLLNAIGASDLIQAVQTHAARHGADWAALGRSHHAVTKL